MRHLHQRGPRRAQGPRVDAPLREHAAKGSGYDSLLDLGLNELNACGGLRYCRLQAMDLGLRRARGPAAERSVLGGNLRATQLRLCRGCLLLRLLERRLRDVTLVQ